MDRRNNNGTDNEEKARVLNLITDDGLWSETEEDHGVDYAAEYRKQTGKDLATGEYVIQ